MDWEQLGLTRVQVFPRGEYKMMPLYVKIVNGIVFLSLLIDDNYYLLSIDYYKTAAGAYNYKEKEDMKIYVKTNEFVYYIDRPYLGELSKTCVDRVERKKE